MRFITQDTDDMEMNLFHSDLIVSFMYFLNINATL